MIFDLATTRRHIAEQADRLERRLEAIGETEWHQPTICTEWDVADIVTHLATGAERQLRSIDRGRRGEIGPLLTDPRERDALIESRRGTPGAEVLLDFRKQVGALNALFETITPEDLDKPAWHITGLHPISWFILSRLGELTIHRGDIVQGLGDSIVYSAEIAELLLPGYLERLQRLFIKDQAEDLDALIEIRVTGDKSEPFRLHIAQGQAQVVDQPNSSASAELTIESDAATLLLMATGRVQPQQAQAQGVLRAGGRTQLLDRWRELFRTL